MISAVPSTTVRVAAEVAITAYVIASMFGNGLHPHLELVQEIHAMNRFFLVLHLHDAMEDHAEHETGDTTTDPSGHDHTIAWFTTLATAPRPSLELLCLDDGHLEAILDRPIHTEPESAWFLRPTRERKTIPKGTGSGVPARAPPSA